jgi:hypothetical protein
MNKRLSSEKIINVGVSHEHIGVAQNFLILGVPSSKSSRVPPIELSPLTMVVLVESRATIAQLAKA